LSYVTCDTHLIYMWNVGLMSNSIYIELTKKKKKKNQIQNLKSIFTKLASVYCQKLQRSNDKLLDSCDDNGHL